ncbi:MAG: 5-(carboxyamino)imidazole ribonucleotide mutase [Lentisphaerae bacterium RIFOXYA12_64_32]|nr:MAG: 5-(carboxyamino)imidazole ribonucleotide mutase [Lentisphaerae bacterium RIFOXYA12_64_32]
MTAKVAVLMGSRSDLPKIQDTIDTLREFEVPHTVRVMSAHRTPGVVREFAETAAERGFRVLIAAAGSAAHLAGALAAHSPLPIIGIPVEGGSFNGLDALLSTVQMPGGVPVATVGVGRGGAKNAALLAVQILALDDPELATRFHEFRARNQDQVARADAELQNELTT